MFVEVLGESISHATYFALLMCVDTFFDNVCELDLVFHFYKVYAILDEVFLAGEIEETSKEVVLLRLDELDKLE